jgi:hypothetical protein
MPCKWLKTRSIVAAWGTALVSAGALAAPDSSDCKLGVAAAATALGVPATRANPYQGHTKMPPDNMDVLTCGYAEASVDPRARVLGYTVYTPLAQDLAKVFSSVAHSSISGNPQPFPPGVGSESTGWVRASSVAGTFDGSIVFLMPSYGKDQGRHDAQCRRCQNRARQCRQGTGQVLSVTGCAGAAVRR